MASLRPILAAAILLFSLAAVADCYAPQVEIRSVRLANVNVAAVEEQEKIAGEIVGRCLDPENAQHQAAELVRMGFQDAGFFKAFVDNATFSADSGEVTAQVHEGLRYTLKSIQLRYTLKSIQFRGNKALASTALRALFDIRDNAIFSRRIIATGIENLRKAYSQYGYINFSPVPDTTINDDDKTVSLSIDVDEGKQFSIRSFQIAVADPQLEARLRSLCPECIKVGDVYNARLVETFFERAKPFLPPDAAVDRDLLVKLNQSEGTVDITLCVRCDSIPGGGSTR